MPPSYLDEPLAIIEEKARAMAQCFGVAPPEEAASLIDRRLGGTHIYLPRQGARARQRMHAEIALRFNGNNLFELAKEFEMAPRHVRRIIADRRS